MGGIKGCNIFWVKNWQNLQLRGRAHYRATSKNFESRNLLSESEELQSWGFSKHLLSILMRFDGHFLLIQQQRQQCLPQFESILVGHLSRHLLPAPVRLEIENTT
jgi:hypothetical protein